MKFLHTADLHLKKQEDLFIVELIVEKAKNFDADVILIAGDLFDSDSAYQDIEAPLISRLEAFDGEILILPGNHDNIYLSKRNRLSLNSKVLNTPEPFLSLKRGDITIRAVPFKEDFALSEITLRPDNPDRTLLLIHGSFYDSSFFYDDEHKNYLPILKSDVSGLYGYVALGHYHKAFERKLGTTLLINPGSPVVTRQSDIGERKVALVDSKDWSFEWAALPVPYNLPLELYFSVFETPEDFLTRAITKIRDTHFSLENATLICKIKGLLPRDFTPIILREQMENRLKNEFPQLKFTIDISSLAVAGPGLLENTLVKRTFSALEKDAENEEEARFLKNLALSRFIKAL